MNVKQGPRILLLDIETLPNVVTAFQLKVASGYIAPHNIVTEGTLICAAWKWLDQPLVHTASVLSHPGTKEYPDKGVIKALHKVMNAADAIIAHYGDGFDLPKINARIIVMNLGPIKPFVSIDTKKIAKSKFMFNSNSLNYLGKYLGLGEKIVTDYTLWQDCMKGDKEAIRKMVVYNKEDVMLLERIYLRLRPYVQSKLNHMLFSSDTKTCPTCGDPSLAPRGRHYTRTQVRHNFRCASCGAWSYKLGKAGVIR